MEVRKPTDSFLDNVLAGKLWLPGQVAGEQSAGLDAHGWARLRTAVGGQADPPALDRRGDVMWSCATYPAAGHTADRGVERICA
ncbi:hypothetical protein ACFRQM_48475 [Streptomyces sp. NPDC056831]|uniref:hypothetical protein n=1 Tax=Streptomyces sp. NPDC056831 TaxID=3345954 RepID=UPI00369F8C77